MDDIHLTREMLRAVARGDLPPRVLVETGLQHLTSLCPYCREEYLAWWQEQSGAPSRSIAFRVLPAVIDRHSEEVAHEEQTAMRDLRELLELPLPARLAKIDRAVTRFRGATLAGRLLDESKRHMAGDPQRAQDLAETAEAVLRRSRRGPGVADQSARAAAYIANSLRARGDLPAARERFAFARSLIQSLGVTNPLVYAEIDSAEAVLSMDQRQFAKAKELIDRSVALYTLAGVREGAAHPLVTLGLVHYHQGEYEQALEATRTAAALIQPELDPRLYLSARHNLALFLCECGSYQAAADALKEDGNLYRQFPDRYTTLRLSWLEGKIAAGFGRTEEAERLFLATRDGFMHQGIGYDAAMVALDLALIYLRQDRAGELLRLAGEMHRIFAAGDVHREAVAALLLFEEAVRRGSLTKELIEELVTYLRRARTDPALRFREPLPPDPWSAAAE